MNAKVGGGTRSLRFGMMNYECKSRLRHSKSTFWNDEL